MEKLSNKYINKSFLMDNVSFHKSKDMINMVNNKRNRVIHIPPYSPELNPIEEVFSKFKILVVKENGNILSKIKNVLNSLKKCNFENYYKHSYS